MARRSREAVGRRANLRRRILEDYEIPPTEGPHESSETASLIFTGAPGGAAEKAVARFGPKGFKLAKKGTESAAKYIMRTLKPIVGKSVKVVK